MKLKPLNSLKRYKEFSDDYFIGDDGNIYRRLKSGYFRAKMYPYQQVRSKFGTGKQHTVHVHRAVAEAFVENPNGYTDVDHIDNDKSNNSADNLQWLTHQENMEKARKRKE